MTDSASSIAGVGAGLDGEGPTAESDKTMQWLWAAETQPRCCLRCGRRFSRLNKRYTCRACSLAVCGECSSLRPPLHANVRLCGPCFSLNEHRAKIEQNPRPTPCKVLSGTLWKQGHNAKTWRKRSWLLDSNGILSYFEPDKTKSKGEINLVNVSSLKREPNQSLGKPSTVKPEWEFAVEAQRRTYYMGAESAADSRRWREAISLFGSLCLGCGQKCFEQTTLESLLELSTGVKNVGLELRPSVTSRPSLSNGGPVLSPPNPAENEPGDDVLMLHGASCIYHRRCLKCDVCHKALEPVEEASKSEVYVFDKVAMCFEHAQEQALTHSDPGSDSDPEVTRMSVHLMPSTTKKVAVEDYCLVRNSDIRQRVRLVARLQVEQQQQEAAATPGSVPTPASANGANGVEEEAEEDIPEEVFAGQPLPEMLVAAFLGILDSAGTTSSPEPSVRRRIYPPNSRAFDFIYHKPSVFNSIRQKLGIT